MDIKIICKSKKDKLNAIKLLKAYGVTPHLQGTSTIEEYVEIDYLQSYPNLLVTKRNAHCYSCTDKYQVDGKSFTYNFPNDAGALITQLTKPKNNTKIGKYQATVNHDKKTVTVGCQTISFSEIRDLVKIMDQDQDN